MEQTIFSTRDLPLSATLLALGHVLVSMNRDPNGRANFLFNDSTQLKSDISGFWNQEIRLSPQILFDSLKFLKSRIYHEIK